jgi:hypothetical protein
MAADQVERLSTYLRDSSFEDVIREAEDMARRQPLLFLGGAFLAGFLGARFLKSSSPSEGAGMSYRRSGMERGFYRQPGYGTSPGQGSRPDVSGYRTPSPGTSPSMPAGTSSTGETSEPSTTRPLPPSEHLEKTDEAA